MRKIVAFLAGLSLAASAVAQSGPKFSTSGGVGSSTSTYVGGEPNGGTYTINGTTGTVSTPIVNLRPGSAPPSPSNGDCWTTITGLFCRINGATVGPYASSVGAGTVTSVGLVPPSIFTAGAPVTTSGNLSFTLNSQTANQFLAAPDGSSGTPSFRALVGADVPAANLAASGNGGVTGTLPVANGGTGSTTAANARTALGLGTMATQNAATVAITGGSIAGITDLAVADGGTGASTLTGYVKGNGTSAFTASSTVPGSDVSGNISGNAANVTGTVAVANGGTGVTTSTGTGSVVLSTSPTLTTPSLGTPSVATLTNATGLPLTTGVTGVLPVANGGTGAATGSANRVFATPNGSTGAPSFRALVAADIPASQRVFNVRDYGAACDGPTGTNSRAGVQAALDAAAPYGGTVLLPPDGLCRLNTQITLAAGVSLVGEGYNGTSGLAAGATNLAPMVLLDGDGAQIRNMYIKADAAGANSTGRMIQTGVRTQITIRDIYMVGPCGAIGVDGNLHDVSNVYIYQAACAGGAVIVVGANTTLSGSNDIRFDGVVVNTVTNAQRPSSCMDIYDAGGLYVTRGDMLFCGVGTRIIPGANQQTVWGTFVDTYLGDTTSYASLYIEPQAASAVIKGVSFNGGWASSSSGSWNTYVGNAGGGTVDGLLFAGYRSMGGSGDAINIGHSSIKNVRIDGAMLCGYGGSGVFAATGVSDLQVTNSTIRPNCAAHSGAGVYGVLLAGSNANVTLGNLDLRSNATAGAAGTPTGDSFVSNITSQSNIFGTKASAATVNLDQIVDKWTITGTTTVTTLGNAWNGRVATLVTTGGAVTFNTGGNICAAYTSVQNVPILATYSGTCWYLK